MTTHKQDTDNLIKTLCNDASPVSCLCPYRSVIKWIIVALPISLLAIGWFGFRPDMGTVASNLLWDTRVVTSLMTGITAALAAFWTGIPGLPRKFLLTPFVFLGIWLLSLIGSAIVHAQEAGENIAFTYENSPTCFTAMTFYAIPLVIAMYYFLKRFRTTSPAETSGLMGLSVFSFCAGMWEFHDHGATPYVQLYWHFGTVIFYTVAFYLFGRYLFKWSTA